MTNSDTVKNKHDQLDQGYLIMSIKIMPDSQSNAKINKCFSWPPSQLTPPSPICHMSYLVAAIVLFSRFIIISNCTYMQTITKWYFLHHKCKDRYVYQDNQMNILSLIYELPFNQQVPSSLKICFRSKTCICFMFVHIL